MKMADFDGGSQPAEAGAARPSRLAKASAILGIITLIDALLLTVCVWRDFRLRDSIATVIVLVALAGIIPAALGFAAIIRIARGTLPRVDSERAKSGLVSGLLAFAIMFWVVPPLSAAHDMGPSCQSNLKQIGLAIGMYRADYNEDMPASLQVLAREGYLRGDLSVCRCPDFPGPSAIDPSDVDATGDYCYTPIKKEYVDDDLVPIAWDKRVRGTSPGANVLFASHRVARMPVPELDAALDAKASYYVRPPQKPDIVDRKLGWLDWLRELLQG
jgi:hypothetical protein